MLLALILGPMMEEHLRRAMRLSRGDPSIFLRRPISLVVLIVAILALVIAVLPSNKAKREEAFKEE
jgi:TctA family transporter